ncbi:uncharacterized protein C1orf87 homolog [Ambystoma mexicanum]|uniref:uncharacterized protein C1orf87 homolog n=1 Tax=Ambystoma mexicanum TaxID=8296 RepID=UPI0037E75CFE
MASARDAPFGNDATPETVVKIIGSKYVSCVVYKPYIQAPRDAPRQTQDGIIQPSGGPTKESIDASDPLSHSRNTALDCEHRTQEANKQNNIKESLFNRSFLDEQVFMAPDDVQCLTAPTGDQTFSFIHTFRRLCDAPQSVNGCKAQHPAQLQNSCKRPIYPDSEEESLITTIRNELKLDNFSVQKCDNFQRELKNLDPTMSGSLRQSQISVLLLKLELPLSLPTIQKLFRMSAKPKDAELVNYEKLLQILKGALPNSMKSVEEPTQETSTKKQDLDNQMKRSTTSSAAYEKMSQIMTQAITECAGKLDLEKISLIFQNKDRSHSGLLPAFEIVLVCQQHGLTVSPGLLKEVLCNPHLCVKDRIRQVDILQIYPRQSEWCAF